MQYRILLQWDAQFCSDIFQITGVFCRFEMFARIFSWREYLDRVLDFPDRQIAAVRTGIFRMEKAMCSRAKHKNPADV